MPDSLDFVQTVDDRQPAKSKLSYSAANRPIREYEEGLHRLLEKLDSVESAGITEIRDARRGAVKNIEAMLGQLDSKVELEWKKLYSKGRSLVNSNWAQKGYQEAVITDNCAKRELWQHADVDEAESEAEIELTSPPSWSMPVLKLPTA